MLNTNATILECAGCTAPLSEAIIATGVHRCPFCGYVNILPKEEQSSEVMHYLYSGDAELKDYEFERAYNAYSKATELDSEESKAYFGMALASNRVKYIKDIVNNRWQAICCEVTDKEFSDDKNYLRALDHATPEQKEEYISRAKEIDYIREKFAELEASGLDYDTFICVKVSDGQGGFTQDAVWANRLYDSISGAGAKPFYSEKDMGSRVGADYEALILYALYKAESMIIVCSNEEYLRTPWVQNEYTRYYAMMNEQEKLKNSIMIAFSGHTVERIPGIPGRIQGVDLHNYDASQKINDFVNKFANAEERARKKAAEKERRDAERKAKEEAQEKVILELQNELKSLKKQSKDFDNSLKNDVKYCSKCITRNALNVKFCVECGNTEFYDSNQKYCIKCKTPNSLTSKFCLECGNTVFASEKELRSIEENERKAREEAERKAREEAERKAREEAERKAREEAERKAREEAERKAREEAERKAREEAERKAREEAERKAREEAERKAREEAERKAREEAERKAREEAERKAHEEAERIAREEAARKVREEIERIAREKAEAERKARQEAERLAREKAEAERKAREEAERKAREEAERKAREEAERKAREEAECKAREEAERKVREEAEAERKALKEKQRYLVLPQNITKVEEFSFHGNTNIEELFIPEGVTEIGEYAFKNCTSLRKVKMAKSMVSIGYEAFSGCTALTEIEIPEKVVNIGKGAFKNCSSLCIIRLNAVSIEENAFNDREIFSGVGSNTTGTTVIVGENVSKIPSYFFSDTIGLSFETKITRVDFADNSKCKKIGASAFCNCKSLAYVKLSEGLEIIDTSAFAACENLMNINIPSTLKKIGTAAFADCESLKSIYLPKMVDFVGKGAFENCKKLTIRCCTNKMSKDLPDGFDKNWLGLDKKKAKVKWIR